MTFLEWLLSLLGLQRTLPAAPQLATDAAAPFAIPAALPAPVPTYTPASSSSPAGDVLSVAKDVKTVVGAATAVVGAATSLGLIGGGTAAAAGGTAAAAAAAPVAVAAAAPAAAATGGTTAVAGAGSVAGVGAATVVATAAGVVVAAAVLGVTWYAAIDDLINDPNALTEKQRRDTLNGLMAKVQLVPGGQALGPVPTVTNADDPAQVQVAHSYLKAGMRLLGDTSRELGLDRVQAMIQARAYYTTATTDLKRMSAL